jgi:hypothetical protein
MRLCVVVLFHVFDYRDRFHIMTTIFLFGFRRSDSNAGRMRSHASLQSGHLTQVHGMHVVTCSIRAVGIVVRVVVVVAGDGQVFAADSSPRLSCTSSQLR